MVGKPSAARLNRLADATVAGKGLGTSAIVPPIARLCVQALHRPCRTLKDHEKGLRFYAEAFKFVKALERCLETLMDTSAIIFDLRFVPPIVPPL